MRKFTPPILSLFLAIALAGCVGVISFNNPSTIYKGDEVKPGARGWCCSGQSVVRTKDDVRTRWGDPDEIHQEGNLEKWRYTQDNLAWAAVMPVLIFPIPIGIPTGHNYTVFAFEGDQIVFAEATERKGYMALCGFFANDVNSKLNFGCISDNDKE